MKRWFNIGGRAAFLAGFGCFANSVFAQNTYILSSDDSSAIVNATSSSGMNNWTVDGNNYLNTQWFWVATGSSASTVSAPTPINNLGLLSVSQPAANDLVCTYGNSSFNIQVSYLMDGGQPGSGSSDISENISLNNTSTNSLYLRFYQYSDFLFGPNSTVALGKNIHGLYNLADVTSQSGIELSETVATPGANEGEAAVAPTTLNELNGGAPYMLNDVSSAGPGANDATWAFEWDVTLAAEGMHGSSFEISKDKSLDVPEPGSMALLALGAAGLLLARRSRKAVR